MDEKTRWAIVELRTSARLSRRYADGRAVTFPGAMGDSLTSDKIAQLVSEIREERDRAVREVETRFHEAADSAPAPVWMTNAEGKVEFANRAFQEFSGLTADALTGDVWLSLLHADDLPAVVARRAKAWGEGHAPYSFEARFKCADGEWRVMEVSSRPRFDRNGAFQGYVGLAVDRTDARRAEAILRDGAAQKAAMLELALDAVISMDGRGRIVEFNTAAERIFGYEPNDAIGRDMADLIIPPDLRKAHREGLARILKAPRDSKILGRRIELKGLRRDGSEFPAELAVTRIPTAGEPLFTGFIRDITDRKRAEQTIREDEERYRDIFENVGVSVWEEDFSEVFDALDELRASGVKEIRGYLEQRTNVLDSLIAKVKILDVNAATLSIFGAKRKEELIGSLSAIFTDEARDIFIEEMAAIWSGRSHLEAETRVRNLAGEVLDVLFTIVFGGVRGARTLVSISDITGRKRAEVRQRLLLDELNHRVKNTLSSVQSIAMQSLSGENAAEGRDVFIARLFALAKGHDLLTRENWEGAPLANVVERAIEPFAGGVHTRFRTDGPFVWTPPRHVLSLTMALHELCTNAAKYGALSSDSGLVSISWRIEGPAAAMVLRFDWVETGGPPVTAPKRRGFGSRMIEQGLKQELGGEVVFEFAPSGVLCSIAAPLRNRP